MCEFLDQCQNTNLKKLYRAGESVSEAESGESTSANGVDLVFISLPCDSKKFGFDYAALATQYTKGKRGKKW